MKILENYTSEMQRRNYAENSVKVYTGCFKVFIKNYSGQDIRYISEENILKFLKMMVDTRHISPSYQNQLINAIKFYYEKILHLPRKTYYIDRPRRVRKLPNVLSVPEMRRLFAACTNLKHKVILLLLYSTGMRESEIINLEVKDIDGEKNVIHVRQAKRFKDRFVPLSLKTKLLLREYYKEYRPENILFYGQNGKNEFYTASSMREWLKKYARISGITKNVHPHLIRHCFATHLHESGTELALLQLLLGHESIKTTMIYTHISTRRISEANTPDNAL